MILQNKTIKLLLGAIACASPFCNQVVAKEAATKKSKPNLLVIHTDEQSFRSLSCYENSWSEIKTPNIDKLAKKGVKFENFFANHPVCTPSRAALLTGKYAYQVDSYLNDIPMSDEAVTFGHILREKGYTTGYSGKLHLDGHGKPAFQPDRDFGFTEHRYMFNRGHWKMITEKDGKPQTYTYKEIGDEESYTTDYLTNKTIQFINENKDNNWCYMVCYPDPHGPDTERSLYSKMFDPEKMSIPESFYLDESVKPKWASAEMKSPRTDAQLQKLKKTKAVYCGMVKHIDDCVGKVMALLEENGQLDNTIVVYMADHGDLMGEYGRYNKGVPMDGSAKIPFIISYPEKLRKGTVIRKTASNVDFIPSILDLMEIKYDYTNLEGKSFIPLITDPKNAEWDDISFMSISKWVGVVTSEYKLVYSQYEEPWLYNRKSDPSEQKNYFNNPEYKGVIVDLTTKLKQHLESTGDPNWTNELSKFARLRYGNSRKIKKLDTSKIKSEILKYSK